MGSARPHPLFCFEVEIIFGWLYILFVLELVCSQFETAGLYSGLYSTVQASVQARAGLAAPSVLIP